MSTPVSQSLIDAANCLLCTLPPGMVNYIVLAQLRLNAGGSVAVPQSLIDTAACELCQIPPGMVPYMILAQLITNGGGGASAYVQGGAIDPNGVVTGPLYGIYNQVVGGATTLWTNIDGGTTWK